MAFGRLLAIIFSAGVLCLQIQVHEKASISRKSALVKRRLVGPVRMQQELRLDAVYPG